MTVASAVSTVSYQADGVTTEFPVPFQFLAGGDLVLSVYGSDGVRSKTLSLGADYTVAGAGDVAGGSVILRVAAAADQTLVIDRDPPATQAASYSANDRFPAKVTERGLDKLTMLVQRLIARMDLAEVRALRVPEREGVAALPRAAERAGRLLTFDAAGQPITVAPASGSAVDVLNDLASTAGYLGVSLVSGAPRVVPTIAALRSLPKTGTAHVLVAGYHQPGDGGGGAFRLAAATTGTAADDGGLTIIASDGGGWSRLDQTALHVKHFGAVGDGAANDTAAFNAAASALGHGGMIAVPPGKYKLTSNVTLGRNTALIGALARPAMQRDNLYADIASTLILSGSIVLSPGSTIRGFNIVRPELIAAMPYATAAAASAAIATYSGTAIIGIAPVAGAYGDVEVSGCAIAGYQQGITISGYNRPVVQYNHVDCTNGIDISEAYDVGSISHNNCIPFTTAVDGGGSAVPDWRNVTRSGTAFKTSGVVDTPTLLQNFAFGYQVGFDIESIGSITLIKCGADHVAWMGTEGNIGQIGFLFRGSNTAGVSAGIRMIGCDAAAQDKGVLLAGNVSIMIEGCDFWGNASHIYSTQHKSLSVFGCTFRYLNGNWAFTAGISITSTVTGATVVQGNTFDGIYPAWGFSPASTTQANISSNAYINGAVNNLAERCDFWDNGSREVRVFRSNADGSDLKYSKARGTLAAPAALQASDIIFRVLGTSYTGASWLPSASIRAAATGAASTSGAPTALIFSTASGTTLADRWLIAPEGHLLPVVSNSVTLGSSANLVQSIWAANGTIQVSDARTKTDIAESVLGLDFILGLRPVSYRFREGGRTVTGQNYIDGPIAGTSTDLDAVPADVTFETTPGKRTHWGFIAQEVEALARKAGVDFGGWVQDDPENPDSLQALRYEQFIAPIVTAMKQLALRVSALENGKTQ